MREDPTKEGLLYLSGCFLPIMSLWFFKLYFHARYHLDDDIFHHTVQVGGLLALGNAVLHIRPVSVLADTTHNVDMFVFALSLCIAYGIANLRHIEVLICCDRKECEGLLFPEAFAASRRDVCVMVLPTLFLLAAALVAGMDYYGNSSGRRLADATTTESNHLPVWLLLASSLSYTTILGVVICWWFGRHSDPKSVTVPMNISYNIHRYGEWTMLLLGESVLSLLIVTLSQSVQYYGTFFSGILTIVLLEYLHFRSQPHEPDAHALRRNRSAGYFFAVIYQLYSISLIVLGTCYKMFLYEFVYQDESIGRRFLAGKSAALRFDTEDRRERIAHLFSGSLAITWACMDCINVAHVGIARDLERYRASSTSCKVLAVAISLGRLVLIVWVGTLSQYMTSPQQLAACGLAGVMGQLVVRFLGDWAFPPNDDGEEIEELIMASLAAARIRENSQQQVISLNHPSRH